VHDEPKMVMYEAVNMKSRRTITFSLSALVVLWTVPLLDATLRNAWACACCTNLGQRSVGVAKLDAYKIGVLEEMRFASMANLYSGEADPSDTKGISSPSVSYELKAGWSKEQLTFTFRDETGKSGTLSLRRPGTVSIFAVDPRTQDQEGSQGPALYKEWKITSKPTGSGIFNVGFGANQLLTVIFQGRGNSCTSADDFSHWTLVMQGPKANYMFFGRLVTSGESPVTGEQSEPAEEPAR